MDGTATALRPGVDVARSIARATGEPSWLAEWREHAWAEHEAQPVPSRVAHLWRYSEPEKFLIDGTSQVMPMVPEPAVTPADYTTPQPGPDDDRTAGSIRLRDGRVIELRLSDDARAAGVVLCDLSVAAAQHAETMQRALGTAVPADSGKLEALNAALFSGGVFLHIQPNVVLEQPIHILVEGSRDLSALFTRLLLVLDTGASATVLAEYANPVAAAGGPPPRSVANTVVEGLVGQNARLAYFDIQRWGARTRSHSKQRLHVDRDGGVMSVNIGLGGQYNKTDLGNVLVGENAEAEMIGVIFGSDRQHFDNHTEHLHRVGHSFSDMDFKVVLEDRARSVYTGLIRIDLQAPNSEAYQENRNLLLDPNCRAESIPELEILNDEVRCTHGATVGPIDEEQVFYLMTRGLNRQQAERSIVEGFFGPALARIADEQLRDRLWGYVSRKLSTRR